MKEIFNELESMVIDKFGVKKCKIEKVNENLFLSIDGLCGSSFSSCVINCNTNEIIEIRLKGNNLKKVIDKGYEISNYVWQLFPEIEN